MRQLVTTVFEVLGLAAIATAAALGANDVLGPAGAFAAGGVTMLGESLLIAWVG